MQGNFSKTADAIQTRLIQFIALYYQATISVTTVNYSKIVERAVLRTALVIYYNSIAHQHSERFNVIDTSEFHYVML